MILPVETTHLNAICSPEIRHTFGTINVRIFPKTFCARLGNLHSPDGDYRSFKRDINQHQPAPSNRSPGRRRSAAELCAAAGSLPLFRCIPRRLPCVVRGGRRKKRSTGSLRIASHLGAKDLLLLSPERYWLRY